MKENTVEMVIEAENSEVRLKEIDNESFKDIFLRARKVAPYRIIFDNESFI